MSTNDVTRHGYPGPIVRTGQVVLGDALRDAGVAVVEGCSVGGCDAVPEATITIAGFPLRMCGDHARQIEGALERRQQA